MLKPRLVVLMGSKSDLSFARRIGDFLEREGFHIRCEYNISSAHKTPDMLLSKLEDFDKSGDETVYITVAGLSDALSGIVAGFTKYPVIACPPDFEKFDWPKVFSSAVTPEGVAVLFVPRPENAALAAAKILALSDPSLYSEIERYRQKKRDEILEMNSEIRGELVE